MDNFPFWAIFCKLMIRKRGRQTRVYIEIPSGAANRAIKLQEYLKAGRVEEGTLLVEGRELPRAMATLGFPPRIVDCVARLWQLRGIPGIMTPEPQLEDRMTVIEKLKMVAKEELDALK